MENLGCQNWDVSLKVYVKPYSVFTGGKFVFQTFIPAILQLYQTSHIKETSQMKEWQKLQVAGIAQLPVPVISTAMVAMEVTVEVPVTHVPVTHLQGYVCVSNCYTSYITTLSKVIHICFDSALEEAGGRNCPACGACTIRCEGGDGGDGGGESGGGGGGDTLNYFPVFENYSEKGVVKIRFRKYFV